jgi:Uma2 family endonuclease
MGAVMSQRSPLRYPARRRSLLLSDVDWHTYSRLLRIFENRPGYRLTYDRGELEIMSPSIAHDHADRFLFRMVITLTEELGQPIYEGGSVTMRRRSKRRGLESDDCFWIANAARMAGRQELDLRVDPPPDLAIEVDVTNSSLDRMGIYRALRVPEVWRLEGDLLTFHVLNPSGEYEVVPVSKTFPWVTPADLLVFVQQPRQAGDSNAVIRDFRAWIGQRRAALGI